MFMLRKLLKLVRGQITGFQVMVACMVGAALGFMPGLAQAPGLIVVLTLLLIVLNTPLVLAGVTGGVASLASLVLMPISYHLGRLLLDGPTQPLFKSLINAPVLALFGFEYYVTTGGLLLGLLFGAGVGAGVVALLRTFRRKMASLEEGSTRYQKWTGKRWVRVLTWIVAGGGPKQGYQAMLAAKKRTQPVRLLGVAVAVGVLAVAGVVHLFFSGPIVTAMLQHGLERTNGATVDLRHAEINLREGRLLIEGLAMADPHALETDIFRAARLEADLGVADLLRRRLTMERVVISDASSGETRRVRGAQTRTAPRSMPEPTHPDDKTLDDYLVEAKRWRDRLAQLRQWMERIAGPGDEPETAEQRETLRERLARWAREHGYASVRAEHLVDGAPTLLVRDLLAEKVRVAQLEGETLDIHGRNLSTHAHLVDAPPSITVRSSGGTLLAEVLLNAAAANGAGRENRIQLALRQLSGDRLGAWLAISGTPLIAGGTVDLVSDGSWQAGEVNLPFNVTLHDTTLTAPGTQGQRVSRLELPLGLRGPLDNPRVMLDDDTLADALVRAGADELASRARGEARRVIDRATEDVADRVPGDAANRLRGLLGGEDD
ncbi:MAG: hypothetical protein WD151_08505 [Phycisphaeraceae bacterium]